MANFNDAIQSFINGLSDFWLLYFKEKDQLEALYKGTEILVGQSYLDMLSLLLNNSIQDTTIFNKEFFKLVTIKESDLTYTAGDNKRGDRYVFTFEDGTSDLKYLHNKVLNPTAAWDEGKDFDLEIGAADSTESYLKFKYDPTNAYAQLLVGTPESRIFLRARELETEGWTISFYDDVLFPEPVAQVFQDTYTVIFDGAGNNSRDSTDSILQAIRDSAQFNASFITELESGSGKISPKVVCDYQLLSLQDTAPLDNYAVREISTQFDCHLIGPTNAVFTELTGPSFWPAAGVHKGYILRLLVGATLGRPQELRLKLHRGIDLYADRLNPEEDLRFEDGDNFRFAVLRDTADPYSLNEPFSHSGVIVDTGTDGSLNENTKAFTVTTPTFHPAHVGDVLHLTGLRNYGSPTIIDYVDEYTVVVGLPNALTEPIVDPVAGLNFPGLITWSLRSIHAPTYLEDIVFAGYGDLLSDGRQLIGATFSNPPTTDVLGKVLYIQIGGIPVKANITDIAGNIAYAEYPIEGTAVFGSPASIATTVPDAELHMFRVRDGGNQVGAYPKEGTTVVKARRYVDNKVVQEGIDYEVNVDTFTVTPLTVWSTSVLNTFDYEYRRFLGYSEQLGGGFTQYSSGTITPASGSNPATFAYTSGSTTDDDLVGQFLTVSGSGLPDEENDQVYIITGFTYPTFTLGAVPAVSPTPDPNNGNLTAIVGISWSMSVTDVIADELEIAMWAPDAQLDKFHLYHTYGYLVNRFERSSEDYRALVRGLFQLFMLGPTLERFESAINTVAGLGTIRDDGEILLGYADGADQTGTDGELDFDTATFYSLTAAFTNDSVGEYVYITEGANENTLFHIQRVLNANTVEVIPRPVTASGVAWEVTSTATQTVTTSRTAYTFDRQIPIKETVKDPASIGTIIFRAFETLTEVFRVTDYVETPTWWESVQIPENLLPNALPARRQSTPNLFENVVNPGDEGLVGDPGFIIGADSEGFTPPQVLLRDDAGAADGNLIGDPLFPNTNDVRFTSATAAFTALDVNSLVAVPAGGTTYRITEIVSATEVKLEAFTEVASLSSQSWEILASPLAKRHKAAFVILNEVLKHQMFEVEFDAALLGILPANVITDLEELVFVAKPTYTYLVLTPSTLFDEVVTVGESLITRPALLLGGSLGNIFKGNTNTLNVIGSSWRVGTWFRYEEHTSTFAAPIVTLTDALGAPDAGYTKHVNKILIDQNDFTSDDVAIGYPIDPFWLDALQLVGFGASSDITVTGTDAVIDLGTAADSWWALSCVAVVNGSGLGNDGLYPVGKATGNTVTVWANSLVDETGVSVFIYAFGTGDGRVYKTDTGLSMFYEADVGNFNPTFVGSYVYRYFDAYETNQVLRYGRNVDSNTMELFTVNRVDPIEDDPDYTCTITGGTTLTDAGTALFSSEMGRLERIAADYATSDVRRYYVEFTTGTNAGTRALIDSVLSPGVITLNTSVTNETCDYFIEVEVAYNVQEETTVWWQGSNVYTPSGADVEFGGSIAQNANPTVNYTAYGVREPDDPSIETFDETVGDTLYSIGMVDPRPRGGRSRSGWHVDIREEPVQITRTPFP